jgi:hypothetical protein
MLLKKPNISSVILSCLQKQGSKTHTSNMITKPSDRANNSMIISLQQ